MPGHLLLIENDHQLARTLVQILCGAGYEVRHAPSGIRGLTEVREHRPDLVLLDLSLHDLDSAEVVTRLRRGHHVHIIAIRDQHGGSLNRADVDDYLLKPVVASELLDLVRTRLQNGHADDIRVGALALRPSERTCLFNDVDLQLTAKEYEIIALLAQHPGRVFPREEITRGLWQGPVPSGNVLDVHIANLRSKLRGRDGYGVLRTVRGVGYILRPDA
jgi:DNA-binding response OmpR family regulator